MGRDMVIAVGILDSIMCRILGPAWQKCGSNLAWDCVAFALRLRHVYIKHLRSLLAFRAHLMCFVCLH